MNSTTPHEQFQSRENPEEIDALSLYRALEQGSDQRHKRGVRYPLAVILSLVVLGKLAGMTSLAGKALVGALTGRLAETRCCHSPERVCPVPPPTAMWLSTVEAEEVTQLLADWLTRLSAARCCGGEPSRLLLQPEARKQHVHVVEDSQNTARHARSRWL